ncbi:hydrogenase iron-sulfur subunit [Candidatus Bathyarchaeota archaeon]|nr:hydrogenase iron-sulfur subunit [Candidatus Bathyarchaeota archaeon]
MRIGVVISPWGTSPDTTAKVGGLAVYAETLPYVAAVNAGYYGPTEKDLAKFKKWIKESKVDRVVFASCRPRLFKEAYRSAAVDVGVNKYLIEVVDISELCAAEAGDEILAEKAKILLRAAVNRVGSLEEVKSQRIPVEQAALVIGGGLVGMEAAIRLADQGYKVHLVEKQPWLGGKTPQLGTCFPSQDCGNCIAPFHGELHRRCMYRSPVAQHPNVELHTLSKLKKLVGVVGNFRAFIETEPRYIDAEKCIGCGVCEELCEGEAPNEFDLGLSKRKAVYIPSNQSLPRIPYMDRESCGNAEELAEACPVGAIDLGMEKTEKILKVGTVIVATGFDMYEPKGMYGYGEYPDVTTQLHLARLLDMSGPTGGALKRLSDGEKPEKVVMVQCVGSRDPRIHEYCSRICCGIAVKHSLDIKKRWPDVDVTILHKDIRLNGKDYERFYYEAEELGVKLVRGEAGSVTEQKGGFVFHYTDEFDEPAELEADMVVLSNGTEASAGNEALAKALGVDLNPDGFLNEKHPKLSPVETNIGGVYIAGACQGPMDIQHSMNQVLYATSKASTLLGKKEIEVELTKAIVDEDKCVGCGACASACPFDAITWSDFGQPVVNVEACTGCGICAATCPVAAMQLRLFRDEQVLPAIEGLLKPTKWLEDRDEPVIVAFACEGAAGYASELANQMGMKMPDNVRFLKVPCSGRLDALHFMKAFDLGADGVVVFACPEDQCHYVDGSRKAEDRVTYMKKTLDVLGVGGDRLGIYNVNSCEPDRLVALATAFAEKIGAKPAAPKQASMDKKNTFFPL